MKYFTIKELCRSTTADRKGIDNRCGSDIEANLTALVDNVLDPLREWYGKPIVVNSGYRCPALNKAVGGATTSQHMSGQAADIDTLAISCIAGNRLCGGLVPSARAFAGRNPYRNKDTDGCQT